LGFNLPTFSSLSGENRCGLWLDIIEDEN